VRFECRMIPYAEKWGRLGRSGFDELGGKNVFDVYSKSQATALGGTKYSEW
jgi:hypothetical protein